jgi:endonuclease G
MGSDIENRVYFPPDKEFFKDIPATISIVWNKIEMQTKIWAMEFDSVYVVTGMKEVEDSVLGPKTYYYKVILKGCLGDGLGFWVDTESQNRSIKSLTMPINKLEQRTNINFFPSLDKDLQEIFEASINWEFWPISIE